MLGLEVVAAQRGDHHNQVRAQSVRAFAAPPFHWCRGRPGYHYQGHPQGLSPAGSPASSSHSRSPGSRTGSRRCLRCSRLVCRPALIDLSEEPQTTPPTAADESSTVMMYMVFEGYAEEVEAQASRTLKVCLASGGRDTGPEPARRYWDTRHDSAYSYRERFLSGKPIERQTSGWTRTTELPHVAIPASKVLEYRSRCRELAARARSARQGVLPVDATGAVLGDTGGRRNGGAGRARVN